jgi:hypothetical protein
MKSDREEVMRDLKKVDTPILTGYRIFHNYVRRHETVKGKPPSSNAKIGTVERITAVIVASAKRRLISIFWFFVDFIYSFYYYRLT